MSRARVQVFEGIGHLPHLEAPERFNELVLGVLCCGAMMALKPQQTA